MSEALFQFLLTGAILLELSAIITGELTAETAAKTIGAAILLAGAAMIRPTGVMLPLFAPIPFLLAKRTTWPWGLALGLLAFAIPSAAMLAWTARNKRIAGVDVPSSDSVITIFDYNAAGVLAYATHVPFAQVTAELDRDIGWQEGSSQSPSTFAQAMTRESFQVFAESPLATLVVTLRGLVLVATVPDRNELNRMIGTNGGGPLGLPPLFDIATRIRRTMRAPVLAILVLLQFGFNLFLWAGVARGLFHANWRSKVERACMLIPLAAAFAMLACAASPDAHARFRIPAVPFLAMLAGIGWLGERPRSSRFAEAAVGEKRGG